MMNVGIVGATGYAGVELIRLLLAHPGIAIKRLTSRAEAGRRIDDLFPSLRGYLSLAFEDPAESRFDDCDLVFFATPHAVSMHSMTDLLARGKRVIDLSADFRLRDVDIWQEWYGTTHAAPELIADAVYGLPEVNREQISGAQLVACPGCYPTAVQLGFLPLLEANAIEPDRLIASCASGTSGAGRAAKVNLLLAEASTSMKAYAVSGHRHLPEMKQGLTAIAGSEVDLTFVPHLAPMTRGIHATLFAKMTKSEVDVATLYSSRYRDEAFVLMTTGQYDPETRHVGGTNRCEMSVTRPGGGDTVVITAAIDNLVKGAAGQAIQVMNIMLGEPETLGLTSPAVVP
ncbi:MAG: N-acetyl-gamma-glutamyl-phosphate reductase [Halieaceae bacterium MED-G27]|nr:MAG: N-acetyl-gamma-glutamyl-phosphate reductase [Halieaceae bacterium MED-G27]